MANSGEVLRQMRWGFPLAGLTAAMLARWRRPAWVDHALFAVSMTVWAFLWSWTESWVFSTIVGSLVWLSWRASRQPQT